MLTGTSSSTASSTAVAASGTGSTGASTPTAAESQDRFLKLLVAQLNNQDPMNPMDNAQMTSQMAQMSTVSGIEQVNATLKSMADQFNAMQMLQGSSMVGHNVLVNSNVLTPVNGIANGAMDLAGKADSVKVQVMSPGGKVVDTIDVGASAAGRVNFNWNASSYQGGGNPTFQVQATLGGQPVAATPLAQDTVVSVGMVSGSMNVQFQNRASVPYSSVQAIL
jgi:flagellar basal-body rod modification protein FlgD